MDPSHFYTSGYCRAWFGLLASQQLKHAIKVREIPVLDSDSSLALVVGDAHPSAQQALQFRLRGADVCIDWLFRTRLWLVQRGVAVIVHTLFELFHRQSQVNGRLSQQFEPVRVEERGGFEQQA